MAISNMAKLSSRFFIIISAFIFAACGIVMFIANRLGLCVFSYVILLDIFLVTLCTVPAVYLFVVRPINNNYKDLMVMARDAHLAHERAELIFKISPSAIFTTDTDRCITSWNDRAAEITGFSASEVVGKTCSYVTDLPCSQGCALYSDKIKKPIIGRECLIRCKDGRKIVILKNADYLKDVEGKVIGGIETFEDITGRKYVEDELQHSRDFLNEVINALADPIFVKNERHELVLFNNAYAQLVGREPKDLMGKTAHQMYDKRDAEYFWAHEQEVLDNGSLKTTEERFVDASGKRRIAVVKRILYCDPKGRKFIVNAAIDVTEVKRLEHIKDDFINTVSHELRTPLSITKEGISLILDKIPGSINEKQSSILTTAKNNIDRLARIINDILDISNIESGKMKLRREVFDVAALLKSMVSILEKQMLDKGLTVSLDMPSDGLLVYADEDRIGQVVMHILTNALRFTDKGRIDLKARGRDEWIECTIADTGIGIEKENLEKVFNKFQQFGRLPGPGEKGTGLGLAISKSILELHGGKIWIESALGKGTSVTFLVPRDAH